MEAAGDALAARLASIRERLDHQPGVMLGVLRLPILDPILDELEALTGEERPAAPDAAAPDAAVPDGPALTPGVTQQLARLADLLSREMLGAAPEAVQRRVRVVELLRRADGGRLPALVADDQDLFGAELRAMLESDEGLRASLGRLHPLVIRATSVAPSGRWLRDARDLAAAPDGPAPSGAQPIRQVDREVFAPVAMDVSPTADRRFGGRIVDHAQLRTLLRGRGWAVPALGAWDLGDDATGWRVFDAGLRAELRYQAVDRVPTAERVVRARIVAVRFVRTGAAPASPADPAATTVSIEDVPRRTLSEAIRDVSLAVVVAERPADT